MPAKRDSTGKFLPGQSGNPAGRKKMPDDIRKALTGLVPDAIAVKAAVLHDEFAPLDLRNRVAEEVLNRVYGRPGIMASDGSNEALARLDMILHAFNNAVNGETD